MIAGIAIFAVLILLQSTGNKFLTAGVPPQDVSGQIKALAITIVINFVCLIFCCAGIRFGNKGDDEKVNQLEKEIEIYED
mmetsp:Transcript_24913/g.27564  ORF Transcript_24913/g.27564 Transcript_24913/m.27564 type:complete len:80 (-) Transcript_24913:85-324(-)